MTEVPVTAVDVLLDRHKVNLIVVPGHHRKPKALELARAQQDIPEDANCSVWVATVDIAYPEEAAKQLMKTAVELRQAIFK